MEGNLSVGEEFPLTSEFKESIIQVGLSWDLTSSNSPADLDSSCVLFDSFGNVLDAVYYNQLSSANGEIVHSGDSKSGKDQGENEVITVDLSKILPQVKVLMFSITCYRGGNFSSVESARANVRLDGRVIKSVSVGCQGSYTGLIPCMLFRRSDQWFFKNISRTGDAKDFKGLEPLMKSSMEFLIPKVIQEEGVYLDTHKVFNMQKGDSLGIQGSSFVMGLGWDTGVFTTDLDSSCILCKDNGDTEVIYFGNKVSTNEAVVLTGDNMTGKGKGDDEQIIIKCDLLDPDVNALVFGITIYSGGNFLIVKHAYCRLVDQSSQQEICRYKLSGSTLHTAMIMCGLFRSKGKWTLKAFGKTSGGNTARDLVSKVNKIVAKYREKNVGYQVTIVEGKGLVSKDSNGFSDPYVKILSPVKEKSKHIEKTLNPVWNFKFNLPTLPPTISLEVWDHDTLKDDFMGSAEIEINQGLNYERPHTMEIQLKPKDKKNQVSGHLIVTIEKL